MEGSSVPLMVVNVGPVLLAVSPGTLERLLPLLLRGVAACAPPRGVPGVAALVEERYVDHMC